MDKSHSRLLQVVITLTLFNLAPDGRATTYNGDPVTTVGTRIQEPSWEPPRNYEEPTDDPGERSGSDGSGDDDSDESHDDAVCAAIKAAIPDGCNLKSPPPLVPNGCGAGVTAGIVPDFLIANGVPVERFGNLFTSACNRHDVCYGTLGKDKDQCDIALGIDMLNKAKDVITGRQWVFYESHVIVQASAYSAFLRSSFGSIFSNSAFGSAQVAAVCRSLQSAAVEANCEL